MDFSISETVVTSAPAGMVWDRLLDADAVTGFLGVAEDIRPYRPDDGEAASGGEEDDAGEPFLGHTFRVVGLGGGVYHAAFDEIDEPNRLAYAIWRDDTPEAICLLTYTLRSEGEGTSVEASIAMDMPIEELFGLYGSILMPVVEPMAKGFAAHRLRQHLRNLVLAHA